MGARNSRLAQAQTLLIADAIRRVRPDLAVDVQPIVTQGDRKLDKPLPEIGGKGLFTAELEQTLLSGQIDLAVHSAKDLPVVQAERLDLLCVPARGPVNDVLVSRRGARLADLPAGARVGTSSLRRLLQLRAIRPDLHFADIRGNVDTRIRKAREGQYEAVVLAQAGLIRAGLADAISEVFPAEQVLPAPGQAALAVQGRSDDQWLRSVLEPINDASTSACLAAERMLVAMLRLDCQMPFAALCEPAADGFAMRAWLADSSGDPAIRISVTAGTSAEAARAAWRRLEEAGGREIIERLRR